MIAPSNTTNLKKGSLTIAGSGIASIGHITLETLSYIKEADSICYLVTDPATEVFILDNTQATCFNLRRLYGQDKDRYITYVQMCEVMLRDVRAGHTVLGIFYGHPGIFVNPSHRAIAIAREEGFEARMLPGVSAEDYMFADLGFDPATFGCAAYEASDLIYRGRRLDPTINNIIWQVGGVGVTTMAYDTAKFNLLVDHLKRDFGPDHKVVHYVGAVLPQSQSIIASFTISDLSKDDVAKQFNPSSTLYIPPRDPLGALNPMAKELGIGEREHQGRRYPRLEWLGPQFTVPPAYGPIEQEAIAEMDARELPQPDKVLRQVSPAMKKFMTDLALSPKFLKEYRDDPWDVVDNAQGLTEIERLALKLNRAAAICAVMTAAPSDATDNHGPTPEEVEGANDGGHSTYAVGVLAI